MPEGWPEAVLYLELHLSYFYITIVGLVEAME
jgi:hypothetical protein